MKIRLIFQDGFIAPVENAKMEYSFKTVVVDVPESLPMTTFGGRLIKPVLIGGEWIEEIKNGVHADLDKIKQGGTNDG